MGKKWDTIPNYQEWCYKRAKELLRVLKPGGYCLIFGGTRTHHRLVCAFEDAGFEIKDEIQWLYGQGFPKSYNISKGFDKQTGVERKVIGKYTHPIAKDGQRTGNKNPYQSIGNMNGSYDITVPTTDLAKQWDGWGTALKPAHEPIMVSQKPREGTYCHNVEKWGVGGLNIDDSRIEYNIEDTNPATNPLYRKQNGYKIEHGIDNNPSAYALKKEKGKMNIDNNGRFPANVILDEMATQILDEQSGMLKSGTNCTRRKEGTFLEHGGLGKIGDVQITYGDSGGASRFFYCPKTSTKDKTESGKVDNKHPTVKPTELIKYLVRLVTPKNGTCLDICEGSGTHIKACLELIAENYPVNYIGFEKDGDSYKIALDREKTVKEDLRMA